MIGKLAIVLISLLASTGSDKASSPHDIASLLQWGPYSKEYYGISHIEEMDAAAKVEFCLVPGQYRRSFKVPCTLYETDVHPWKVSTDMRHITYRHEIEWKDRQYVDATYHILDDNSVLLEAHCVNGTDMLQNINLQLAVRRTAEQVGDRPLPGGFDPEELVEGGEDFALRYPGSSLWYGVSWNYALCELRQFRNSTLEGIMPYNVSDHVKKVFDGDGKGHFTVNFLRPVTLKPHSDTTMYQLFVCGDREYVAGRLADFHKDENAFAQAVPQEPAAPDFLPQAGGYSLGEQLIEATILTNVVYPIDAFGLPIRHFCPGKHWNSLYTWDCGFIGWGMSQIDPGRGYEIIRQYTTGPDEEQPFVHHGTPLAIQIMAMEDVWNRLESDEAVLAEIYPRLKRFYDHMVATYSRPSGMLMTWDLFYNSGGWDDYAAQKYLTDHKDLRARTAPVVSTAYYLRCAKILRLMASHLGNKADVAAFSKDIARMSEALQTLSWDAECGYFSYVVHDDSGKTGTIFRTAEGVNFNMGIDGISPLVAGIGSAAQNERMLSHIFSDGELWSGCGVSAVDRSAPYYRVDGYWNGTVWMPHQMILWKTMLDLGLADRARQIAYTALDKWQQECSDSYNCYEHFMIDSGRGGGWFNFSGLSSPMINWFCAYFKPGTVNAGFNTLVSRSHFNESFNGYSAVLEFDRDAAGQTGTVLVCLSPEYEYEAFVDGKKVELSSPHSGLVEIPVKAGKKSRKLEVRPKI